MTTLPARSRARSGVRRIWVPMCACVLALSLASPRAGAQDAPAEPMAQASAQADAPATPPEGASKDAKLERATLGVWPYNPLRNLKEGAIGLFDRQNGITLATGVVAILGARTQDNAMQEYFNKKERLGDLDNLGNHYLGTGVPGTILGASFWLLGDLINHPYLAHSGQAQIEALFFTGVLTSVFKGAFNRERPDGSDHYSFPSGHTSTVFTSAMVLQEFYGWKAGVPGFLLGALTAAARMSDNRHWFSDTVGGATLGILVGHSFARAHLDRHDKYAKEKQLAVFPVIEDGGGRMVFRLTF